MFTSKTRRWGVALPIMAVLAVGGLALSTHAEDEQQQRDEQEVKTVSGELVDAREYLLWGTEGKPEADEEETRTRVREFFTRSAPDMPFVLVPDEESLDLIERIMPGEEVFLVICDPEEADSREAYRAIQDSVGEAVHVTGTLHAREGLHAISVLSVIERPAEETAGVVRQD